LQISLDELQAGWFTPSMVANKDREGNHWIHTFIQPAEFGRVGQRTKKLSLVHTKNHLQLNSTEEYGEFR
jgi:hypothetical protein